MKFKIFGFGSRIKNRSFDYQPQHYDPVKDKLNNQLKGYESGVDTTELIKQRLKQNFRSSVSTTANTSNYSKSVQKKSNIRLLIILIVLIGISLFLINRYLPVLDNYLN